MSSMGFAEIHFHLLPGVDDGPSSLDESVELARLAAAEGTRTIVATPHVNTCFATDVRSLPERVREVADRLREKRLPLDVVCGGELDPQLLGRLSQPELESIAQGPPGSRWVLLEAPLGGLDEVFSTAARELRSRGLAVVVAHPERSLESAESGWKLLQRELDAGSALQLNAWSLAGLNGERAQSIARALLHATPVVAVASDAHGAQRTPSLRLAVDALTALGERDPRRFVDAIPHKLLEQGLPARSSARAA
jgi:protein-tyrosine phosphatase